MFWTNFDFLCKSVGTTPNALARELGIRSSGTVTAWKKNGALPRQNTLNDIANKFSVTVEELVSCDLRERKKPTLVNEDELEEKYTIEVEDLTADEVRQVRAFVSGIKASRMP